MSSNISYQKFCSYYCLGVHETIFSYTTVVPACFRKAGLPLAIMCLLASSEHPTVIWKGLVDYFGRNISVARDACVLAPADLLYIVAVERAPLTPYTKKILLSTDTTDEFIVEYERIVVARGSVEESRRDVYVANEIEAHEVVYGEPPKSSDFDEEEEEEDNDKRGDTRVVKAPAAIVICIGGYNGRSKCVMVAQVKPSLEHVNVKNRPSVRMMVELPEQDADIMSSYCPGAPYTERISMMLRKGVLRVEDLDYKRKLKH